MRPDSLNRKRPIVAPQRRHHTRTITVPRRHLPIIRDVVVGWATEPDPIDTWPGLIARHTAKRWRRRAHLTGFVAGAASMGLGFFVGTVAFGAAFVGVMTDALGVAAVLFGGGT